MGITHARCVGVCALALTVACGSPALDDNIDLAALALTPSTTGSDVLELHMIDIGQGDSILVVSPDGHTLLVDTAKEHQSHRVVEYLENLGITSLNYLLSTHYDRDHIGGADVVVESLAGLDVALDHGGSDSGREFDEYVSAVRGKRRTLRAGDSFSMGSGVQTRVLRAGTGNSKNDRSVALLLGHGNNDFLLAGDCERSCYRSLNVSDIEFYKVNHHGSRNGTDLEFASAMNPLVSAISLDFDNNFGHPAAEVLDALNAVDSAIYRTDQDGTIPVISDGLTLRVNGQVYSRDGVVPPPLVGAVFVSEVAYDVMGTDSAGEFISLTNSGGSALSLSGWTVRDEISSWTFPEGASIGAGQTIEVARSRNGFSDLVGRFPDVDGLTLSLSNSGDLIELTNASGVTQDFVAWEGVSSWPLEAFTGQSLIRVNPSANTPAAWAVAVTQ
ncbi:MAG: lamin tail domain-containing protein [Myxococcota bacterium]